MCRQYFPIIIIFVLILAGCICFICAAVSADENSYNETAARAQLATVVTSIQESYDSNSTSFLYRYDFDDGSIVSEEGNFKYVGEQLTGFGRGYFRFTIRRKIYEFHYDIHESRVRGVLSFASKYGTTVEETFAQILNGTWVDRHNEYYNRDRDTLMPVDEYFLRAGDFFFLSFNLHFPLSAHHPEFGCEFSAEPSSNYSLFSCTTYENRTETVVDFTRNKANSEWLENYRLSLIKTLSYENHHDGVGGYKLNYVFSTGASIEEVGKIADNDSVSFADGFIRFNISEAFIELNYTGNAEAYNLAIYYPEEDGFLNQTQSELYLMDSSSTSVTDPRVRWYSDSIYTDIYTYREAMYIDKQPFVKAMLLLRLRIPRFGGYTVVFNINEIHSYGEVLSALRKRISKTVFMSMVG